MHNKGIGPLHGDEKVPWDTDHHIKPPLGAQAASATGAARETAQEAVRRAEDNLQAAKDKAAQTASSAYQATKGKAHETFEAGRDTAQQAAEAAIEHAQAALQAARDKVIFRQAMDL